MSLRFDPADAQSAIDDSSSAAAAADADAAVSSARAWNSSTPEVPYRPLHPLPPISTVSSTGRSAVSQVISDVEVSLDFPRRTLDVSLANENPEILYETPSAICRRAVVNMADSDPEYEEGIAFTNPTSPTQLSHPVCVILKSLKFRPSPSDSSRLRFEFEIFQNLKKNPTADEVERLTAPPLTFDGIAFHSPLTLHSLSPSSESPSLLFPDIGGRPLSELVGSLYKIADGSGLADFLHCAIALCDSLIFLHSNGIVYRSLRPQSILYNPSSHECCYLDYSYSSLLANERISADQANLDPAHLPYISPEETGRNNRLVTTQSDLYSFGCLLYELLTGYTPFQSTDPLELIHFHLAKAPPLLSTAHLIDHHLWSTSNASISSTSTRSAGAPVFHSSRSQSFDANSSLIARFSSDSEMLPISLNSPAPIPIPAPLCSIIHKLLSKTCEDRYQTALGLKYDLLQLMKLAESATPRMDPADLSSFIVGSCDSHSVFRLSEKLYGRQSQVDTLMRAFSSSSSLGVPHFVLVSGMSGIGKCWGYNTKLLLADGRSRFVQDIRAGDKLLGDDSTPRTVLAGSVIRGRAEMFEVSSKNKGRQRWSCNGDHILVLKWNQRPTLVREAENREAFYYKTIEYNENCSGNQLVRSMIHSFPTESLAEASQQIAAQKWIPLIVEMSVNEFLRLNKSIQSAAQMFQPDRVQFQPPANTRSLHQRFSSIIGHSASESELREAAHSLGIWLADGANRNFGPEFNELLRDYELLAEIRFPHELLSESDSIRQAILEGQIDGAGRYKPQLEPEPVQNGFEYQYSSNQRQLIEGFVNLARTLGFSTSAVQHNNQESGKEFKSFQVQMCGPGLERLQMALPHKRIPATRTSQSNAQPNKDQRCDGFSIRSIGIGDYYGFQLSGNGRCLLGDFVVTHNTSVVEEIHKPIVRSRGLFLKGKFDQFVRNLSCLVSAFRKFILQVLSEEKASREKWKAEFLAALNGGAQVIIELIPEFEMLIGPQPPLQKIGPEESEFRFQSAFQRFLSVLSQPSHPLVLFIDDLQWADPTSFKWMKMLWTQESANLLVIGAFRDNEVDQAHPLWKFLQNCLTDSDCKFDIQKEPWLCEMPQSSRLQFINLQALTRTDVADLVSDTLFCPESHAAPLATLLHQQTQGNPFYVNQLLSAFNQQKLIEFEFSLGAWRWDVEKLKFHDLGTDVVDLLCRMIEKFSPEMQELMKYMAALGNSFDFRILSKVSALNEVSTAQNVWKIIQTGLILPIGKAFELFLFSRRSSIGAAKINQPNSNAESGTQVLLSGIADLQLRFLHDRVQQAAYRLIPAAQRPAFHYRIGSQMLSSLDQNQVESRIFDVVDQLILGSPLVNSVAESAQVLKLNRIAGRRAKAATAQEHAVKYFSVGAKMLVRIADIHAGRSIVDQFAGEFDKLSEVNILDLVTRSPWDLPEFAADTFSLYYELCECLFLSNEYSLCLAVLSVLHTHCSSLLDSVVLFELEMQSFIQMREMRDGLDTGLRALEKLGFNLESEIRVGSPDDETPPLLDVNALATKPQMTDPIDLATMRILTNLCAPTYVLDGALFARVACSMVKLACDRGLSAYALSGLGLYGIVTCGFGCLKSSALVGKICLEMCDRFPEFTRAFRAKVNGCIHYHIWPWHRPMRECVKPLKEGYEAGLMAGDLEWAGYCCFYHQDAIFFTNPDFRAIANSQHEAIMGLLKRKQLLQSTYLNIWRRLVLKILLEALEQYEFHGKLTSDQIILNELEETSHHMFLHTFYTADLILNYMKRDFGKAVASGKSALLHAGGVMGMPTNAAHCAFYSLALLGEIEVPPEHSFELPQVNKLEPIVMENPKVSQPESEEESTRRKSANRDRLATVLEQQKILRTWAMSCPANWGPMFELIEAERQRVYFVLSFDSNEFVSPCGLTLTVAKLFDRAILSARKSGILNFDSLALELAARYYYSIERFQESRMYFKEAYHAYSKQNNKLKLGQLEQEFQALKLNFRKKSVTILNTIPDTPPTGLLSNSMRSLMSPSNSAPILGDSSNPFSVGVRQSFDVRAIMEVCQTLSAELVLERLLSRLMMAILKHAGASSGHLALQPADSTHESDSDDWKVEISARLDQTRSQQSSGAISSEESISPIEDGFHRRANRANRPISPSLSPSSSNSSDSTDSIPGSIFRSLNFHSLPNNRPLVECLPLSVFRRVVSTRQPFLLNGPELTAFITSNPDEKYFQDLKGENRPKCLLCAPILQQSKLIGVLYLENAYFASAFTSTHMQILQFLCSQAALSIENARLYQKLESANKRLEDQVQQRTAELEQRNSELGEEVRVRLAAEADMRRAKEEAEAATKSKSEFLSNMSHEIRTPLNAVLGVSKLLGDTELTSEQSQYLNMISSSGELLLSIINDILDFSKIESAKLELEQREFNLIDSLENASQILYDAATRKGLDFACLIDPRSPRIIIGDSTRLQQILLNLLSNAIKFASTGEIVVVLNSRPIDPVSSMLGSSAASGNENKKPYYWYELEFSVCDTGIGIRPESAGKLFQSFSQADSSTVRKYGGTGLGLMISRRLTEAMKGEMKFSSVFGQGSRFYFSIRVKSPIPPVHDNRFQLAAIQFQNSQLSTILVNKNNESDSLNHLQSPLEVFFSKLLDSNQTDSSINSTNSSNWIELNFFGLKPETRAIFNGKHAIVICDRISTRSMISLMLIAIGIQVKQLQLGNINSETVSPDEFTDFILFDSITPEFDSELASVRSFATRFSRFPILIFLLARRNEKKISSNLIESGSSGIVEAKFFKPLKHRNLLKFIANTMKSREENNGIIKNIGEEKNSIQQQNSTENKSPMEESKQSTQSGNSSSSSSTSASPAAHPRTAAAHPINNLSLTHPLRILLAEDNRINQKMMSMLFKKLGYSTLEIANNGIEVLEKVQVGVIADGVRHDFDVILMDYSMELMDGHECTKKLRELERANHARLPIYIIACTANCTADFRLACSEAGMDDFLGKPIAFDKLTESLKQAFEVIKQRKTKDLI